MYFRVAFQSDILKVVKKLKKLGSNKPLIQQQVDVMKTTGTFRMKNKKLIFQTFEQRTPNSSNCSIAQNIPTLSPQLHPKPSQQSCHHLKKQSKYWNQTEQRLFIQFWLQQILKNPYQNFSFDVPLRRKNYNKSVSQYINKRGLEFNICCWKSPVQCKSKFGTIRRRIQRQRKKIDEKLQFGFIDFILQKSQEYMKENSQIQAKIQKVKQLQQNQSPYVNISLQEYSFLKSQLFQETYDLLQSFVESDRDYRAKI